MYNTLNTGQFYGNREHNGNDTDNPALGKFHIYCTQKQNKQANKVLFVLQNPIFYAIYNHCTEYEYTQSTKRQQKTALFTLQHKIHASKTPIATVPHRHPCTKHTVHIR
jgi:hypothetical protein